MTSVHLASTCVTHAPVGLSMGGFVCTESESYLQGPGHKGSMNVKWNLEPSGLRFPSLHTDTDRDTSHAHEVFGDSGHSSVMEITQGTVETARTWSEHALCWVLLRSSHFHFSMWAGGFLHRVSSRSRKSRIVAHTFNPSA